MAKNWHLEADVSAATLQDLIRQAAPSLVAPGVTAGRYAAVDVIDDQPPAWMTAVRDRLQADGNYVELRQGN